MAGPQVTIDLKRIERNTKAVVERCAQDGIGVFGVTKGTCGMPHVARAMLRGGVAGIAESRFENIHRLRESGIDCPMMLLRSPPLGRAEDVVRNVDVSLQSELATIAEISRVAERLGRVHDIILMIDLGDLREGIWPSDLLSTVEQIMKLPGVRISGVGTNLTCFGAIVPTEDNLSQLVANAYKVERLTGLHLDFVSGGNSSSLPLLLDGRMPPGVNNLRIGEAILQGGRDTFLDKPWKALDCNAFRLSGELLEVKLKPSMPIGKSGIDAFGRKPRFVDEGDRLRGIANIGREDVIVEGLVPIHRGVRVLGASSDHLMLDLTDAEPPLKVGDRVEFRMDYGAMLMAMTSEYVEKMPMHDVAVKETRKCCAIVADAGAAQIARDRDLEGQIRSVGYDVAAPGEEGAIFLSLGETRHVVFAALERVKPDDSLGLIWIDSRTDQALAQILHDLKPRISLENVVIVGLREASPDEAKFIKASRLTVFTMVDIDARGMRDVMKEAIRIASSGTRGFHVSFSPDVADMRNWSEGMGGITVREAHQAMEAIASNGKMVSLSVSSVAPGLAPQLTDTIIHVILSGLGKSIL